MNRHEYSEHIKSTGVPQLDSTTSTGISRFIRILSTTGPRVNIHGNCSTGGQLANQQCLKATGRILQAKTSAQCRHIVRPSAALRNANRDPDLCLSELQIGWKNCLVKSALVMLCSSVRSSYKTDGRTDRRTGRTRNAAY